MGESSRRFESCPLRIKNRGAYKILEDNSGVSGTFHTLHVFIRTANQTLDGHPVTGFEVIIPSYDKEDSKKAGNVLLSTWKWK